MNGPSIYPITNYPQKRSDDFTTPVDNPLIPRPIQNISFIPAPTPIPSTKYYPMKSFLSEDNHVLRFYAEWHEYGQISTYV